MTEWSSDFPNQPQSEVPKAVLNSLRKLPGASGSLPRRLSAFLPRFDRSLHALGRELPANLFALVMAFSLILAMMVTSAQICSSQDTPAPSTTDKDLATQNQAQKRADSSTQPSGQERMFGFVPAYGMVEVGRQPPPLTSGQKLKLSVQYLNPYTFLFVAAEAGVNQARNHPEEYGQGAEGYGKRYGAGFADGLTDGIFVTGVYPSLLRQDPRYYRLSDGGFSHRVGYALTRILVTRQDSGRKAFNFSEVLGSFSSAALAVTYYPKSERDFSDVAERAGVQFAFDAGFNLLKEFYPEIERKFFRKKRKQ
jgi:hypothetical protein